MADPVAIDPIADFLNTLVNGLTTGLAANVIETAAEAQVPFLAAPVIKQIFEWLVDQLAGKISMLEQDGVIRIVFAIEQDSKLYDLMKSLTALQNAHKTGDTDAISKAKQDAINNWGNIIHFPGLAPVKS